MARHDRTLPLGPAGTVGGHNLGCGQTTAEELLEALEVFSAIRPPWWAGAACRGSHPGVTWFPTRGEDTTAAKAICGRCAARGECLAFAMAEDITDGIWGGLNRQERRALRRQAS